ncbi:response regulator [candidate division KSB1 bacterium]|nr:response regulator [candidate division KSB1 bacterium]
MVLTPKKILIVDDEEDITWGISRSLNKEKSLFRVTCAHSGTEALDFLNKSPFDLVISDIRMPGINGLELLLEIRKKFPQTKVIIMTAYGSPEMQHKADMRGSVGYIEKPFEMNNLKKLIFETITEPDDSFQGHLVNIRLEDVIQMYCLSQNAAALTISNGKDMGVVYFQNGAIVHAKCSDLEGESALAYMLTWKKGSFKAIRGDQTSERTIERDWHALLNV